MSNAWLVGVAATLLVTTCPALSRAADISTKKMSIKDNTDPAKRSVAVHSKDPAVLFTNADDPGTNGASLHAYSTTDDFCVVLQGGTNWKNTGSAWKYSDASKNSAQVGDGKLKVKIKSGVTYTLADNGTQGPVNVQVQFGNGTRYCMRCTTPKKNNAKAYVAKDCVAAACDAEPSACPPVPTTTTTSTSSTTSTTACANTPTATVVKGSLTPTLGRFNYNSMIGLPAANSACSSNFPGSHPCQLSELQGAPATDLACLRDTGGTPVMSFWAIDSMAAPLSQCNDDVVSHLNWEYATAHTMSRGQRVTLDNSTGALGSLQTGVQCTIAGTSWVGCCQ